MNQFLTMTIDVVVGVLAFIGLVVSIRWAVEFLFFDAAYDEQQNRYDDEQAQHDKEAMLAAANAEVKAWRKLEHLKKVEARYNWLILKVIARGETTLALYEEFGGYPFVGETTNQFMDRYIDAKLSDATIGE